ncbi:cellulase family glycosylhydrolase [Flavobacterium sp.]|uniref:cellulase family glycosylhydrolase n=1 Tax=Flavobacterium sp. TaxID=239 RepID=UPI002FD95D4C
MNRSTFKPLPIKSCSVLFLLVASMTAYSQGFLHRDGQKIVDGNGNNVLLRGLGIGGLMVQEGYMLKTADFAGPQYQIKQKITDLIGETNAEEFYKAYKKNGLTKRDVDSLAAWGFNSIRLPMHYNLYTLPIEKEATAGENTWLEEGFTMTDNLLSWCEANKMYLILDLHAAPGGQGKDANISDADASKPSLWESTVNQDKMVAFWKKMANHYKDKPWIGGYDIINEPNWNFSGTNQNGCDETKNEPLRALQIRITKAIREVDPNHLIVIEGNCWGNNYKGMFPLWDENIALSFHKYWNYNDVASIQQMLDYRKEQNVPIWLGESGENSNVWFKDAISLMESNNIGWAFWPMKKIDNIAGVTSVKETEGYKKLLKYWKTGKDKPSVEEAKAILMQMAENYKLENVIIKHDVIDAMFRQVQNAETLPFKKHVLPGKVFASEYDLGTVNQAYFDKDVANYWVANGKHTEWNSGNQMRNDGVDIQKCNDKISNGYAVSYIEAGEWLQYTFDLAEAKTFEALIRYSNKTAGGKLYLTDEKGNKLSTEITLPSSGGNAVWKTVSLNTITLKKGINKVRIYFEKGNFNLNYIEFKTPQTKK